MTTFWAKNITHCQVCKKPFGNTMYDANIAGPTAANAWANVCEPCFKRFGRGEVGVGIAQKYEKQPDGRWLMQKPKKS